MTDAPTEPRRRIGVIGAGQLGRMLALAGYPLGLRFVFLDRSEDAPGGQVGEIILGAFSDAERIRELAGSVDVLTFDVENVPEDAVREAVGDTPFLPPVTALAAAQDRLSEKTLFGELGIPTPNFRAVGDEASLREALAELGLPAVLKSRRLGYDGRGQRLLRTAADADGALAALGEVPCVLESFVDFEREVSIIAVRSTTGELRCYPLAHNEHRDGILRITRAPFDDDLLQSQAERHARALLEHFDYHGVLTIEFFVRDGELLANEMAPRVHNSGHWTIEGAVTSQFENHVRAILGLPLGDTRALGHAGMLNLIGEMPATPAVLAIEGAHLHDYGKSPRPARKLGHVTIVRGSVAEREEGLATLAALVP